MKQVLKVVTLYDKERLTIQESRVLANELRIQEILRTAGRLPSGILTPHEITDTTESKEVLVPDSRGGFKTLVFPRGYTMLVKDYIGADLVTP